MKAAACAGMSGQETDHQPYGVVDNLRVGVEEQDEVGRNVMREM